MQEQLPVYEVIRSSRKTFAIQLTGDGRVLVRCPRQMTDAQIRTLVTQKSHWICTHLKKQEPVLPPLSREELAALSHQAAQVFSERTAFFAQLAGVSYGRITIRCQKTRWGSCSSRGNLNFNCLLMLAPPEVLDYVVVHELCHRKQMNHSPAFWQEVARVMPDYQSRRQWLKAHGSALMARLP